MAIKERGVKRNCQECGAVFYDLLNDPIICPKCGSEYDPEAILKSRKTRLPAEEQEVKIENEDAGVTEEDDIAGVELDDDEDVILPDVDDDEQGVSGVEDEPLISEEEVDEDSLDSRSGLIYRKPFHSSGPGCLGSVVHYVWKG